MLSQPNPAARHVEITLHYIKNPTITTAEQTFTGFKIETHHDDYLLDESSTTDPQASIIVKGNVEVISNPVVDFVPENVAEYATYTLHLETNYEIVANTNTDVIVRFPSDYPDRIISDDIVLYCESDPIADSCYANEKREIIFENILVNTTPGYQCSFTIFGITNPSLVPNTQTGSLEIYVVQEHIVRAASDLLGGGTVLVKEPPKNLNMSYVAVDDLHADATTNYEFSFNTISSTLITSDQIWIDWPNEYL